ncbi:NAD(P)-binding domain-containing protein [Alphaproteobacteria bacterium]|nr:NAD(P)-binding domain-containing protein [Alphaproteobacteria bacterium]
MIESYALIGAGPMGLATAKILLEQGIPFQGFEQHSDVGGLWDINAEQSTMYESAHLISSKRMTEFKDFPMSDTAAEYPSHGQVLEYFHAFAERFSIREHFHFGAQVTALEPLGEDGDGWRVTWQDKHGEQSDIYRGIMIANGTLSEANMPKFPGHWDGEMIHASVYREPEFFQGKRVLVVGAGNSGCDIAVDAIHHGLGCDISMRRGYYFVPKYVFGKPADTMGGAIKLPMFLKRKIDALILKWFVGSPEKYGFPKPDYKLYESHPIVNSLLLFHAGHGDIKVRPDVERLDGKTVHFRDGTTADYDLILAATGYKLHYPFIDNRHLNWVGDAPHLYLNCMHPQRDDLFMMGMIEALGLGWHGRYEQAEMVAHYIKAKDSPSGAVVRKQKQAGYRRETGSMSYIDLPRMAYYVDKSTYLKSVRGVIKRLRSQS